MSDEEKLFKVLINLAYVDLELSKNEIDWLTSFISKQSLTSAQKDSLFEELKNPSFEYMDTFRSIESFFTRGRLLDLSRYLLQAYGRFSQNEKSAYAKLNKAHNDISKELLDIQRDAATEIAKDVEELKFFKDLEELGDFLKKRRTFFYYGYIPNLISLEIFGGRRNIFRIGVIIFLVLIVYKLL